MRPCHHAIATCWEAEIRCNWLRLLASRDRHRIARGVTVEDERPVVSDDAGLELRDGLIGSHLQYFGAASNRVAGPNRRFESPVHLKEYRAWPREVLGHESVEDCARHTTLHDDLAEPARLRHC